MKPVHDRNSAPQRTDGDGRKATFFGFELAVHLLGQPHGLCDGANIFNKKLCERGERTSKPVCVIFCGFGRGDRKAVGACLISRGCGLASTITKNTSPTLTIL